MTRRGFFGLAAFLGGVRAEHEHKWDKSPFYLPCSKTFEEPEFYPPSSLMPVELCTCGLIRIDPKTAAMLVGKSRLDDAKS